TLHEPHHQTKQRRFSRSVVTDDSYDTSGIDTHIDRTDRKRVHRFSDVCQFNRLHCATSPFFSICRQPCFGCPVPCSRVAMPSAQPVPTSASPSRVSLQRS